jgi:hypothetical protein
MQRRGLVDHRCSPVEWTKLVVVVSDVGQFLKLRTWHGAKASAMIENLPGKWTPPSGAVMIAQACGSGHRRARITLDAASYVAR